MICTTKIQFCQKKLPQKRNQRLLERYFAKRCFSCRRESQCVFKSTLRPSKRTHSKTLNYKNSDQSVHTAWKNDDLFARAPKFPKIFRAQNLEKLTRPENFGAPHGRPTTRDEILRRDPKFQARAPKFSRRAARRNMLPKLGVLIPRNHFM